VPLALSYVSHFDVFRQHVTRIFTSDTDAPRVGEQEEEGEAGGGGRSGRVGEGEGGREGGREGGSGG
jgi:hypothetical protein